jgi:hypothetical protein
MADDPKFVQKLTDKFHLIELIDDPKSIKELIDLWNLNMKDFLSEVNPNAAIYPEWKAINLSGREIYIWGNDLCNDLWRRFYNKYKDFFKSLGKQENTFLITETVSLQDVLKRNQFQKAPKRTF